MLDRLRRLSRDTVVYGIGGILEQVAALLLLPFFTRVFSPVDYGILDTLATMLSFASLMLLLGMNAAMQRYYFDSEDKQRRVLIVSTSFWSVLVLTTAIAGVVFAFRDALADTLFNQAYGALIGVTALVLPISLAYQLITDVIRLKLQSIRYMIVTTIQFTTRLALSVILVLILHFGLMGNFQALIASTALAGLVGLYFVRDLVRFSFGPRLLPALLRYGIPLALASLAYWALNLIDRLFLLHYSTLEQIGLYSIANRFTSPLFLIINAFQLAWAPFIFSQLQDEGHRPLIAQTLRLFSLLLLGTATVLTLLSRVALSIIAPATYSAALSAVPYLTLGLVFLGTTAVVGAGLTIAKRVQYITYAFLAAAGVNVALNFLLIPDWGMLGAAIATLISYGVLSSLLYHFSQRIYHVAYPLGRIMGQLALTISIMIVAAIFEFEQIGIDTIFKIVLLVIYALVVWFLLPASDRATINLGLRRRLMSKNDHE